MILAFHFFDFDCLGQSRSTRFVVNILQSIFFVFHHLFVYGFDEYFSPLLNNPTTVSTTTVQYRHLPLPLCICVSVRIHDTMSSKSLLLDVVRPTILRPAPNNARIHVSPVRTSPSSTRFPMRTFHCLAPPLSQRRNECPMSNPVNPLPVPHAYSRSTNSNRSSTIWSELALMSASLLRICHAWTAGPCLTRIADCATVERRASTGQTHLGSGLCG